MISLFTFEFLLNSLLYISIGILGAYCKELYATIIKNGEKINAKKLFLGGTLNFIIMPTLEVYLRTYVPVQFLLIIAFLIGVLSIELFNNISTLSQLKNSLKNLKQFKEAVETVKIEYRNNRDEGGDNL